MIRHVRGIVEKSKAAFCARQERSLTLIDLGIAFRMIRLRLGSNSGTTHLSLPTRAPPDRIMPAALLGDPFMIARHAPAVAFRSAPLVVTNL